jgi:hypothetical protein
VKHPVLLGVMDAGIPIANSGFKITNHMFNELTEEYGKWAEKQRCYNTKKYLYLN